jgi:signal transduction histidine kinase
MKLRSKLTLTAALATLLSTLLLGGAVLALGFNAGLALVDEQLAAMARSVENTNDDQLSTALLLVQSQDIGLVYVDVDKSETVLQELRSSADTELVRSKSVSLGDGEKLVFTKSAEYIMQTLQSSIFATLTFSFIAAAIATLITRLVLRKDLLSLSRLTKSASGVAETYSLAPIDPGSSAEVRELNAALETMLEQLQQSQHRLQDFLSDTSHELRTPLTVIRGYLELLTAHDSLDKDKIDAALTKSLNEALRMQNQVNGLLELAELGSVPDDNFESLDLAAIIEDKLADLKALQPKRTVNFTANEPLDLIGSTDQLNRFFANVFANIRNHTDETCEVQVTATVNQHFVQVEIDDAGPGMPELESGAIETKFRRFDKSKDSSGSGLGLSIMAKIAELHGGQLSLSKSPLGGLKVTAYFKRS